MKNTDYKTRAFSVLMLVAGILLLSFMCCRIYFSFDTLSKDYGELLRVDVAASDGEWKELAFSDGILASSSHGLLIDVSEPEMERQYILALHYWIEDFRQLEFSTLSIYTMFVTAFALLFIYEKNPDDKRRQVRFSVAASIVIFSFLFFWCYAVMYVKGLPAYLVSNREMVNILAGILSVAGGSCAVMVLFRKIRFRKMVAVLLIPFLIFTYVMCGHFENRLLTEPEIESFGYVYEIAGEDIAGRLEYDSERNVMILDGKEYEPEIIPNPDALTQPVKSLAILFEALNPYSGIFVYMAWYFTFYETIPAAILFILKAACWIFIPLLLDKKKKSSRAY